MTDAGTQTGPGTAVPDPVDPAPTDPVSTGAADAPDAAGAPRPRRRPTWGLMVPVVTAGAGLMFAMSFQAARGGDLRADRDLPQLIVEGDSAVADKAQTLDELRKEVQALSRAGAPADAHLADLTGRGDRLAVQAATTKVSGPAVEVTLDDAKRTVDSLPDGFTADDIVVHQQDVQGVVNALWAGGAEAMMIQDQRVISTSAVRCVGNTLILQGRVYAPPYTIKAIGDVDRMQSSLDADPSVSIYRQYVDAVGLGYQVHSHQSLEFPAYSGSVDLEHATPIP